MTVKVNDDVYSAKTGGDGYFNVTLDLQPKIPNGQSAYESVTYNMQASFAGDTPVNATAWASMLDGTSYAACTTIQYGCKPCSNSTVLTVDPQSSQAATLTKTPEEVQQEAKDSGWMPPPKSEFGIFYPWFRLHFQFTPNGILVFDVGISPLPFANTAGYASALTVTVTSLLQTASLDIAAAIALSESLSQVAAQFGPEGFIAALLMSTETVAASFIASWNSVEGLFGTFLGLLFSTIVTYSETIVLEGIHIIPKIVDVVRGISNLWDIGFGTLYNMISVPINMAFMILTIVRAIQLGANFAWQ